MRSIHLFFFLCFVLVFSTQYSQAQRNSQHISTEDNGKISMMVSNGELSFQINYQGEITFNEEGTLFENFGKNGQLNYHKGDVKIEVSSDSKGEIAYKVMEDRKELPWDDRAKSLLAVAIHDLIEAGVGASDRAEKLYKRGGYKALMDEFSNFKNEGAKIAYLQYVLNNTRPSQSELTEIAGKIEQEIFSDFNKGRLLKAYSSEDLQQNETAIAWLNAANSIRSDFEKASALKKILDNKLGEASFLLLFKAVNGINSDFEKAGVLKKILNQQTLNTKQQEEVFKAIQGINSDFEKAGILKSMINQTEINAENFNYVLLGSQGISSDFEKAGVLKTLIEKKILPGAEFKNLCHEIASINSDFEKAGVLKRLINLNNEGNEAWMEVLKATNSIHSDFEKAGVLIGMLNKISPEGDLKVEFEKTAKTIQSEFEYGKVMRALK